MSKLSVDKGTVKELAGTLQNATLPPNVRTAAAEGLLAVSKTEQGCAMLCSAGGLHALFIAVKEAGVPPDVLRVSCKTLCALYKFDGKIVSVVARLQGGVRALVDATKEHMHGKDMRLLQWLLCALSDVSHSASNTLTVIDAQGVPVVLATLLAHLRIEQILLPCLYILVNVTRSPAHVPAVVREGCVPAVLAAILAHVGNVALVRTGLLLLRAIAADGSSVLSYAVDGAFRILLAVLHAHGGSGGQLELVRLASCVLWRLYFARHPEMRTLVEAWTQYHPLQAEAGRTGEGGDESEEEEVDLDDGVGGENSSSADEDDGGAGAGRGLGRHASARPGARPGARPNGEDEEDGAALLLASGGDEAAAAELLEGNGELLARADTLGDDDEEEPDAALRPLARVPSAGAKGAADGAPAPPPASLPRAPMFVGGPDLLDATRAEPEPTHQQPAAKMADVVARCIVLDAERLVHPCGPPGRPAVAWSAPGGRPLPSHVPHRPACVYDALPAAEGAPASSPAVPQPDVVPAEDGMPAFAPALRFSSAFESGNLRRALRVREREYDLVLACDVNTRGHTQWFYFRVDGMEADVPYKLNVINMLKSDSLFAHGMRPLLYSTAAARETGVGWQRCGTDICYYQNEYLLRAPGSVPVAAATSARRRRQKEKAEAASYYTLSFVVTLDSAQARRGPAGARGGAAAGEADCVYICQCYPYTHTKLLARVEALQRLPAASAVLRVETLCTSIAGHAVPLLTIADFSGADEQELRARKVVVLTARVHPGETNASWMIDGVIDALLSDSAEARELRSALVFKVVPCLNPDGVILGNYRCSLSGDDLNRNWAEPSATKHPTIAHTKSLLRSLADEERLLLFCDLHGHSRKKGAFMYGVEPPGGKAAPNRLHERVFPLLLARLTPAFSFGSCSFKVLRSKETTGRVVVSRSFGLVHSYTLEASFCGQEGLLGEGAAETHYSIPDLQQLGKAFVHALCHFAGPTGVEYNSALSELEAMLPSKDAAAAEGSADEDAEPAEREETGARLGALPTRRKSAFGGSGGAPSLSKAKKKPAADEVRKRKGAIRKGSGGS